MVAAYLFAGTAATAAFEPDAAEDGELEKERNDQRTPTHLTGRYCEFRRLLEHGGETLSEPAENVMQFPEVFMVGAVQHFPLVKMAGPHDGHEGWSDEGVDVP